MLTLVHGDAHAGNIFVRPTEGCADAATGAGGGPGARARGEGSGIGGGIGFFDWQVASAEQGVRDLAYFLHLSVCPETLREHERRLLGVYVEALNASVASRCAREGGARPPELSAPEAWEQYRLHALYSLLAAVVTSGVADFVADKQLITVMAERCVAACERLDVASALEAAIARHDTR